MSTEFTKKFSSVVECLGWHLDHAETVTTKQLARAAGVGRGTIRNWVQGIGCPDIREVINIGRAAPESLRRDLTALIAAELGYRVEEMDVEADGTPPLKITAMAHMSLSELSYYLIEYLADHRLTSDEASHLQNLMGSVRDSLDKLGFHVRQKSARARSA